jgi:hypothetical protein
MEPSRSEFLPDHIWRNWLTGVGAASDRRRRHWEEQSDEAIQNSSAQAWIASLRSQCEQG